MEEKKKLDPITFSVLANRFDAITRTMLNTMQRTARTTALNVARDFSASICNANCDLVSIAEGIPIHVMTSHWAVKPVLELFDDIAPGDLYINNCPYMGNSHHGDYTHFVPVFSENKLIIWLVLRVHQGDCGCAEPTSYMPWAPDIYQEGVHWPVVRFQRNCKDVKDIIRIAKMRIRAPELWYGNYLAAVGALRVGERECIKVCQKYGNEVIEQFLDEWLDYGDRRMAEEIRSLPKGTWEATTRADPQPYAPEGIPLKMKLTIDPDHAMITVDLRDNPDQVPGGINLTHANSAGTALAGLFFCLDHTIPHNSGAYQHIDVKLREGCICGIPIHPAGTSTATTYIAERLGNLAMNCMAQADPKRGSAEGSIIDRGVDVISGKDPRYGNRDYIQHIMTIYAGGPGVDGYDGWIGFFSSIAQGAPFQETVEIHEEQVPQEIDRHEFIVDSVAAGKFNGGPARELVCAAKGNPFITAGFMDGGEVPPQGVLGGRAAPPNEAYLIERKTGNVLRKLPLSSIEEVKVGEAICIRGGAGGGFGDPLERDPERVRWDAREGLITVGFAQEVYGVVLDTEPELFAVDYEATRRLREAKKSGKEGE